MAVPRAMRDTYVVKFCGECGGQVDNPQPWNGHATVWHTGDCLNRDKVFAPYEVMAVPEPAIERLRGTTIREVAERLRAKGEYACCGFEDEAATFVEEMLNDDLTAIRREREGRVQQLEHRLAANDRELGRRQEQEGRFMEENDALRIVEAMAACVVDVYRGDGAHDGGMHGAINDLAHALGGADRAPF